MNNFLHKLLQLEVEGIGAISSILNESIEKIIEVLAHCDGHVIISGLGKSGIIGRKISATMSSVGVPSFVLCPFNATHGDIGVVTKNDVLILISNSGNPQELIIINDYCKKNGNITIGITRGVNSVLACETNYSIVLPHFSEGNDCDAPTTSTTQTLVIGDILALGASYKKGFTKLDYAKLHPSGNLGRKILKITTIMETNFCTVDANASILDVVKKMTEHSNGFVCITRDGKFSGIITDGDIRRAILNNNCDIQHLVADDISNKFPKFLTEDDYIVDAQNLINTYKIGIVIIVDELHKPCGFISKYSIT
jgi:arabinose-5-phosphate isomerase